MKNVPHERFGSSDVPAWGWVVSDELSSGKSKRCLGQVHPSSPYGVGFFQGFRHGGVPAGLMAEGEGRASHQAPWDLLHQPGSGRWGSAMGDLCWGGQ